MNYALTFKSGRSFVHRSIKAAMAAELLQRLLASIAMLVLVESLFPPPASADEPPTAMNGAAITVSNPARVLLISVASAGQRLVAVGGHGVIIFSDDNGQSWHQSKVPTSETITCVAFATPRIGWAAGGQGVILRSEDAGATWTTQLSGPQVIDLMNAAAAQFSAAKPTDEAAAKALHRSDVFTQAGPDKPFLSILPINAQSAIVTGAYRMTVKTQDGGKTWADWSLHVGDPISHNYYSIAQVGSVIYMAGETGMVLRSDDQGNSFPMITSPNPSTMLDIIGTKNGALLAFGVAGQVFRSTDQGQSWTQSNISAASDLTTGTSLLSGHIVVASEDGHVFSSNDDGVTFHDLGLNEGMALFGSTQAANGDVVFVGSGGARVEPAASFN